MFTRLRPTLRLALLATLLGAAVPAAASAATLSGTVTAKVAATPVGQFTAELYDKDKALIERGCTDAAGRYAFVGESPGSYYVQFSGDPTRCTGTGYATQWYTGTAAGTSLAKFATAITLGVADVGGVDAALQVQGTLSGKVADAAGGAGLAGVAVKAVDADGVETQSACTAADGTFTLLRLNPIPLVVQYVADGSCPGGVTGYPSRYYKAGDTAGSATASGASSVSTDYGQDRPDLDVRLAKVVPRTLTVSTTGSGQVLSASGDLTCPPRCSVTVPDGDTVTLNPVAANGSTFTGWTGACSGAGACSFTMSGDKAAGATFTQRKVGGAISGTVTAASSGSPVGSYTVELYDANKAPLDAECTDAAGAYAFASRPAGTYYVQFSGDPAQCAATGYAPRWYKTSNVAKFADPVVVTEGVDSTGIGVSLQPEGTIAGKVTDAGTGAAVAGVSVRAFDSDSAEVRRACTTADGSYKLRRLTPIPLVVQFVADASCPGGGASYPSRYYRFNEPTGSATAAGASSVSADFGQTTSGIDVKLGGVPQRTLTVTTTGSGSVTSSVGAIACPGTCSTTQPAGTVVALAPTPAAGATFTGWSGACSGTGACSVRLDADATVGATFAPVPASGGSGGGGGAGSGTTGTTGASGAIGTTGGSGTTGAGGPVGGGTGISPPGGSTSTAKVTCRLGTPSKVKAAKTKVSVTCTGRAKLVVGGTVSFKRGTRTATLRLAARTTTATKATVTLKLPAKAARALKAKVRLTARLTVKATTTAGTTTTKAHAKRLR